MPKARKLTPKRDKFCREYLVDMNGTQAAIRAGYSPKNAHTEAARLLADVKVKARIAELGEKQAGKLDLSAAKTLQAIAEVAFGDIRKMFDGNRLKSPDEWDDETAAAIAGLEVTTVSKGEGEVEYINKIKRSDRLRALDMLARHHTLYNDKIQVEVAESLSDRLDRAKTRRAAS